MESFVESAMDQIFNTFGDFEPIHLVREGNAPHPMRGIFSEVTQDVTNGGVVITSSSPNVTIWEKDLPQSLDNTFRFKIRGEAFSIKDHYRDGHGNLTLELFRE